MCSMKQSPTEKKYQRRYKGLLSLLRGLSREANVQTWVTQTQRKYLKSDSFQNILVLPPPAHPHS